MLRPVVLASIFVCLAGCGTASAQGLSGLFLEMTMRSGRIETNHYFFLPDGRYLNGVPEGGLTAAGLELACKPQLKAYAGGSICGTYQIAGGSVIFTPRQGAPESRTYERLADGNMNLDGHFAKRVGSFPKGQTLAGKYARVNSAGPIGYGESFTFQADGTFSTTWLAGARTADGVATSGGAATGTYQLDGNVLTLTANGTTTRLVAYPYDLGNGDVRLNLNGEFFRR